MGSDTGENSTRRLSSKQTNVHWLLVSILFLHCAFVLRVILDDLSITWFPISSSTTLKSSFALGLIIGFLVQRKLMRVDLTSEFLSIRDTFGFRRKKVPLAEIDNVRQFWIFGYVLIGFTRTNCFGSYIVLIPRARLTGDIRWHPDVDALRELVREAKLIGSKH